MRAVKDLPVDSIQSLLLLTCTLIVLPFAVSACAEGEKVSSAAAGASSNNLASKWVGVYDPFSRACSGYPLSIHESTFTLGDCKDVKFRLIAGSDTEFAFEVDPSAKCDWAGEIVALNRPSLESPAVSVNIYRSLTDYQAKGFGAFCAYSKRTN